MQINKDKYLSHFKVVKKNIWHEVLIEVAEFMGEPTLIGKWKRNCKGISYPTLQKWMKEAERNETLPNFSRRKLFNIYKKKFKGK